MTNAMYNEADKNRFKNRICVITIVTMLSLMTGCSRSTLSFLDIDQWRVPVSLPKDNLQMPPEVIVSDLTMPEKTLYSYTVNGKRYQVRAVSVGYKETGLASWYGSKFHGRLTANQEVYDMYKLTAAHKNLPLPSYIRVYNRDNGKSVTVRVNDRGPFVEGRIVDLSYQAAKQIGMTQTGIAPVTIEVIDVPKHKKSNYQPKRF